jgi:protein-disulfide isomerase
MTEKVPPGGRQTPAPEVDLDADLWAAASEPPDEPEPFRIVPWLRSVPAGDDSGKGQTLTDDPELGSAGIPDIDAADPEAGPGPGWEADEPYELAESAPRSRTRTRKARPARRSRAAPTPRPSRTAARDRLRVARERAARKRRRILMAAIGAGLAVLAAAGAVTVVLQHRASGAAVIVKTGSGYAGPYAPVTVSSGDVVTMAQPGVTKPVLEVYEDFQCPPCRAFEQANGGTIQQLADRGKIKVVYYPFTIFVDQPQQANSTRAWAAARCAPAQNWVSYHNLLFAMQPDLTTADGFPVSLLVRLGKNAGITSTAFARCVESQKYAAQDAPVSHQIFTSGPDGLPTLRLNGQILTVNPMSAALRQQLISATS